MKNTNFDNDEDDNGDCDSSHDNQQKEEKHAKEFKRKNIIAQVGCIIDFDGFPLKPAFLVKELGYAYVHKNHFGSFTFKVGNYRELTPENQRTVRWVKNHVHGMRFEDDETLDLPQSDLISVVKEIVAGMDEGQLVAYKGGRIEQDVLRKCKISCMNLETVGCPKFEVLSKKINHFGDAVKCGLHKHLNSHPVKKNKENKNLAHCPTMECLCFKQWCLSQINDDGK